LLYWILHSLELLGESISSQEQEKIVSFLARYRTVHYLFLLLASWKRSSATLPGAGTVHYLYPPSRFMELLGESISSQEQEKIVSFLARYLTLPISSFSLHGVAGRVYFQSGAGKDRQLP
jgi:hypothetical protein